MRGIGSMSALAIVGVAALSANIIAPANVASADSDPERLLKDTEHVIPNGATFTAPADWSISMDGPAVTLEPPEADSWLWIVATTKEEAADAVSEAWALMRPDMKWNLKVVTTRPGRDGWDEERIYVYEVPPNERKMIRASAKRHGAAWTVVAYEMANATWEKRLAQVRIAIQSLRPEGHEKESFAGVNRRSLDADRIAELTDFIQLAMRELQIPGVALSLVDGDRMVFEGGFGVRELGEPTPINADTRFLVASNTKPLTTLLIARLVDEGKLDWETPVVEAYPEFKLGDEDTTRLVRIEHLLCACTGLPRQDFKWIFQFADATPLSAMTSLEDVQPTTDFGELFQYSNLMAAAAGFIAGHSLFPDKELGAAYDEATRVRIFEPLGMEGATFDFALAQQGNHARPHDTDVEGRSAVARMDLNYAVVPLRPAGGLWASARDMRRYVRLELDKGRLPDGVRLVSEENLLARRRETIATGESMFYGMGLSIETRWDVKVISHGGNLFGYMSDMWMLPDHGVGAVLLTNSDSGGLLLEPFGRRLLEVLFDGKPEAEDDLVASARSWRERIATERERLVVPADRAETAKLAGRYHHPVLGDIVVRKSGGETVFDFGEWSSAVASRQNDDGTVSFHTIDPGVGRFAFVANGESLVLRELQHEYVFKAE